MAQAFPFPSTIDGRKTTVTTYLNGSGILIHQVVVWMTPEEAAVWEGRNLPGTPPNYVFLVVESSDLWTLRELAQDWEPKHRSRSLCY